MNDTVSPWKVRWLLWPFFATEAFMSGSEITQALKAIVSELVSVLKLNQQTF